MSHRMSIDWMRKGSDGIAMVRELQQLLTLHAKR